MVGVGGIIDVQRAMDFVRRGEDAGNAWEYAGVREVVRFLSLFSPQCCSGAYKGQDRYMWSEQSLLSFVMKLCRWCCVG